jgi:glucose/arabinose dehydrogenase
VIALVRQGPVSPGTDGDVHVSTSVAASASKLYAGVGSSCNQCIETDPTRASIQVMNLDGSGMTTLATRIRNPIAVTVNPATGTLWAGGAGQDNLTYTHPYEYFDPVTLESPVPAPSPAGATYVDYGWPACEENHHLYNPLGTSPPPDCSKTVEPRVEFPAYSTLIGATFYPASQSGAYAFPSAYRGGAYVTSHGSWHCCPSTLPRLYYVPMSGDTPATAMNWSAPDPTSQSQQIMYDFGGSGSTSYIGRPTGVAVGASGSLFVGDDATGNIYRIRHH